MLDEDVLRNYRPDQVELVLGVGAVAPCDDFSPRFRAVRKFLGCGFHFSGFIHPAAWVASEAKLEPTVQAHAGAMVQPGAVVGAHTILNTGCTVDHDCQIGEFCHVSPGAILSGEVKVGRGSHLGSGCVVIQSIEIGQQCLIAAGATVVKSVESGQNVRGTPAKPFALRHR
jgi:UDP-perosamine 4-acetyltransferase